MTDTVGTWSVGRPAVRGRVEWTLAAGADEVRSAAGLPRRVHEELTGLLDARYGQSTGELANRTAVLASALVLAGAVGSMRLAGSVGHVLVELVGIDPPEQVPTADLFALAGPDETHGYYQTLGEARTQHVTWGLLSLPTAQEDDSSDPDADDVWS